MIHCWDAARWPSLPVLLSCNRKGLGVGKYGEKQWKYGLKRNSCVSYKIHLSPEGRVSIQASVSQHQEKCKWWEAWMNLHSKGGWPKECFGGFPEGAWLVFSSCHLILCFLQVFHEEVEWILRGFYCVCSICANLWNSRCFFQGHWRCVLVTMDHWELKFNKLCRWCWGNTDCDTLSS